jgi:transcriptional regulator of acetoin/glycerol metabolism
MKSVEQSVGFDHPWPGNMRELEQCVRNVLIHGCYEPRARFAPSKGLEALFERMRNTDAPLDEVTAAYSAWAYAKTGTYAGAGRALGVDRRTIAKHVEGTLSTPIKHGNH